MSLHTRAENPKYDSTQWDELQKQYGNLDRTNRDLLKDDELAEEKAVAQMKIDEAKERDKEIERVLERDGDPEELLFDTEEEERVFEEYRAKRLQEMKERCKRNFSGVLDIAADSFKREVTDSADEHTFVVVHLFRDGREDCALVDLWMRELTAEQPQVKFTRIFFSNAIPNYPEANLPTVLVYHKHDIVWSMVTMDALAPPQLLTRENGRKLFSSALTRVGAFKGRVLETRPDEGEQEQGGGGDDGYRSDDSL